jgi:DNA primase
MSSIIEEIKSRLNIVDVAGGYIKLEKAGGNYKACCPFHSEKTPSFFISSARQTYHCFGCNRGGDVISFVEEIEGLDFSGALKILAERAGIELTRERSEAKNERAEIYRALDLATKFYEAVLLKFPDALEYLKGRGLEDETIQQFHIGFAPDEWRALSDFLTKKGISEQAMERAGLIVRSQKGIYDRFRSRIMFPIMDSSGRVIAFSGRIHNESTGKTLGASGSAKYVNSPETEIFHKSRILFGLYQAREELRREDRAVLVEGQMDLILSHQAGIKNAVASSGTALTIDHLALIKRFTKNLTLALDADKAGLSATHRAVELAFDQDMTVSVASIPEGLDPADLILRDREAWSNSIREARHVIDFYLELLPKKYADAHMLRTQISEIVIPLVAHLKNTLDTAHFVGRIASLLHIKEEPIWEEIKKREVLSSVERAREKISEELAPLSRRTRIARIIKSILLWQAGLKETSFEISQYQPRFEKLLEAIPTQEVLFEDTGTLIFEAEARFHGNEQLAQETEELLRNLEEEIHRELFAEKMKQLKEAEKENDIEGAQRLLVECQEISKKLQGFKGT